MWRFWSVGREPIPYPVRSTIITAVLQVIVNVLDFGMNVQDAVDFPRVHHQWKPDRLDFEPGVSPDTIALLKRMGYSVEDAHPEFWRASRPS